MTRAKNGHHDQDEGHNISSKNAKYEERSTKSESLAFFRTSLFALRTLHFSYFGSPRVTLELTPPRGESALAVHAAAHVQSSSPPQPNIKYHIDVSTDGGKT
jgi:hypothetical protein